MPPAFEGQRGRSAPLLCGGVVAEGAPEHVAKVPESHTGRYLVSHLDPDAIAEAAPKKRVRKKAS